MAGKRRAIILVLDGIGAGEMPDAGLYKDAGSNTLANTAISVGGLVMPTLASMGIGNAVAMSGSKAPGLDPVARPIASWGRMLEKSPGKDSTTGHWEMAGIILDKPFPLYPEGFPKEVLDAFSAATGRGVLCNRPYSGTDVIMDYGDEHARTGKLIVYTSGDSVFQIASHVDVVPLEELYEASAIARGILVGEHEVGRVIARPFTGKSGAYVRIGEKRRDYAVEPSVPNLLSIVRAAGMDVTGCGKIDDLFAHKNVSISKHVSGNKATMEALVQSLGEDLPGLIFANCVDFDMLYGHRNDVRGMASALEEVDQLIASAMGRMGDEDLL
ncbi:MAG TPA: phosphopentomutase, partial [Bacillota bacterium]|nr:phosphopentomutase [Bacillota bacterium]